MFHVRGVVLGYCSPIMHLLIINVIFIILMNWQVTAYTGIIPNNPDDPGKCVFRGDVLKLGEHKGPAPCQRLTCREDGSILIEGCGKLKLENCNRGERKYNDKPYPECCKLIYKCKNFDGSTYDIEKDVYDD